MPSNYDYANFAQQQSMSQDSQMLGDQNAMEAQGLQQMKSALQLETAKTGMKFEYGSSQINLLEKISMR